MYSAKEERYDHMVYVRSGSSGLKLPRISLGLWQNFGSVDSYENIRRMLLTAFDLGITYFDLANNYGPSRGSAEENLGRVLKQDLLAYRDELILATKAGYDMWKGPYGNWGSRKYLIASLDQSLRRMGVDYVDIFYHHRPDPKTPMEETAQALSDMVRQGNALYVGLSNYTTENAGRMMGLLKENGTPCIVNQNRYNLFERGLEDGFFELLADKGSGCVIFSPLAQGMLTDKYLNGIPGGSRAARPGTTVQERYITEQKVHMAGKLNALARERGQTLAQMSLSWILTRKQVTSVLTGASRPEQIKENVGIMGAPAFSEEELAQIDRILAGE